MRPTASGRRAAPDRPRDDFAARFPDRFPARDPRIDLLLVHAVHDALRRDVGHLVGWSRTCFPVATPDWVAFRRHLARCLHAEAAVLWGVLRARDLPGSADAEMGRARRRVVLLAATVDDCLTGRGPASRTAEYAAELATALTAYLDYAQVVMLPRVADVITIGEWADFDAALRQPFGLASGVALCAWLSDGSPTDRQRAIRGLFPPAVRLAYRWFGAHHSRRAKWD